MDQEENYLVWMRRQMLMMGSIMNTWEERPFMEDARGQLGGGGCMWPQRSYSCSFCRREFRSAQALGGHMNVHRRDRARLKQSLGPYNVQPSNSTPKVFTSGCDLDLTSFGSLSSSRVSAFSTQESSPNDQKHKKWYPNSNPEVAKSTTNPRGQIPPTCYIGIHEATSSTDVDHKAMNRIDMEGLVSSTTTCKRFKASASGSTLSFLVPNDRCSLQLGHNYSLSSMEEIDLELRLGDPPRVK